MMSFLKEHQVITAVAATLIVLAGGLAFIFLYERRQWRKTHPK